MVRRMASLRSKISRQSMLARLLFARLLPAAFFALHATGAFALGGSASGADRSLVPHLVMVLSKQGARHSACTGTVIARDIVVTAAHCVAGNRQIVIAYAEDGSHVLQRILAKALNPGFSSGSRVSIDLALLRLEGALPARFSPVTLDRGQGAHRVGQSQTIAGFGLQAEQAESTAGTLRSASVSVLPRLFPRYLRLGQGGEPGLSDIAICTGDSGGPVFEAESSTPLLVGVVYGREKFGNAQSCGVTAQAVRIAPQRQWIESVLARWSGQAPGVGQPVSRPPRAKRASVH